MNGVLKAAPGDGYPARLPRALPWLLGLLACGLALVASAPYGAGLGADSLDYLSTADNLLQGRGFVDFTGEPYRFWPPLYPLLLAASARASGLSVFAAARWINALSFGLAAALAGMLLLQAMPRRPFWSVLAALAVLCSPSFISLAVVVSADISFIALSWAFLYASGSYLRRPRTAVAAWMALLAALAAVLRWHGVTLVMVGFFFVLWKAGVLRWRGWLAGLAFGLAASLPFAAWVVGRNYRLFGDFFGPRDFTISYLEANLVDAWQRMGRWLLPASLSERIPQIFFALAGLMLLVWGLRRGGKARLRGWLDSAAVRVALAISPVYLLFDLLTRAPGDHPELFDDRYYLPLFIPLLLLAAAWLEQYLLNGSDGRKVRLARLALILLALAWLVYPGYRGYKLLRSARAGERAYYNIYNTAVYHQSGIVQQLRAGLVPPQAALYSNYPGLVYFFTGRLVQRSPFDPVNYEADPQRISELYQGWPAAPQAYLVWWKPNYYDHFFTPTHLEQIADLRMLVNSKEGTLYRVTSR